MEITKKELQDRAAATQEKIGAAETDTPDIKGPLFKKLEKRMWDTSDVYGRTSCIIPIESFPDLTDEDLQTYAEDNKMKYDPETRVIDWTK